MAAGESKRNGMGRPSVVSGVVAIIAVVAMLLVVGLIVNRGGGGGGGGVAPTPAGFSEAGPEETAASLLAVAAESGRPVMAVVTADWCGPCQLYKRETLSDERVIARLDGAVERVMVDSDASPGLAAELGARSIPRTVLLRDGEIVDALVGAADADRLLGWLEGHGVEVAAAE
mgnify:FL=1